MSWHSKPRQYGEVALPERTMIRGTKGYHPDGRTQAKTPVDAGPSRPLTTRPGIVTRRSHPPAPAPTTAAALAQRAWRRSVGVNPRGPDGLRVGVPT
jgi:hypothetical protein